MQHLKKWAPLVFLMCAGLLTQGCMVDAIWVSRTEINFERDSNPQFFEVANDNSEVGTITVTVTPNRNWILVAPQSLPCEPPKPTGRVTYRIEVGINRSKLTTIGINEGTITLSAPGIKPVTIKVSAIKDKTPNEGELGPLNIVNPIITYGRPYLVEFAFDLRDENDRAVIGEPAQFQIAGYEDDIPVGRPEGLLLRRGAARQLWIEIILDYSIYMREIENAIPEMERAATEVLLPSLNEDALVAVSAFYRDNLDSRLIVPYTVNRQYVIQQIRAIRSTYLTGWASGAKIYEALIDAINRFDGLAGEKDDKYIVLFCNGRSTSSIVTADQVISAAKAKNVHIIAVGFGRSIDSGELMTVALSSNGRFIAASELDTLQHAFERIVEDLNCQYVIRWASARQDAKPIIPSFSITFNNASASYVAPRPFKARDHAGNRLQGELVLIQSETPGNTTVFLRANYVPYDISKFRFYVASNDNFKTTLVGPADDGLLGGWQLIVSTEQDGRKRITIDGKGIPIPFASFGAMLRFEFDKQVETPFTAFEIDNSIYNPEDGQYFVFKP